MSEEDVEPEVAETDDVMGYWEIPHETERVFNNYISGGDSTYEDVVEAVETDVEKSSEQQ